MSDITREEFTQSLDRIHTRIDAINDSSIRMEESSKRIEISVVGVCKAIYGNGKDGLLTKVSNIFTTLKIHQGIILAIFLSIVGFAIFIIRKGI